MGIGGLTHYMIFRAYITRRFFILPTAICLVIFLVMISLECGFRLIISRPRLLNVMPPSVSEQIRCLYRNQIRNIVQANSEMVIYDSELIYRLKPGHFQFFNPEFSNHFEVNSLGLRDTEAALVHPEVVVLGGSMSMGWGVEQDETIAKKIAKKTGFKVLNAGIPAFGTARQLKLLRRIDRSHLKFLVIQYSGFHVLENEKYFLHSNSLPTLNRKELEDRQKNYRLKETWLGKAYSIGYLHHLLRPEADDNCSITSYRSSKSVELFTNVLAHELKYDLSKVPILVFETDYRDFDRFLIPDLEKLIHSSIISPASPLKRVLVVRLKDFLNSQDLYKLDEHLRPSGAEKIAAIIATQISRTP